MEKRYRHFGVYINVALQKKILQGKERGKQK
nr:MAG TPA: hypothetical protein [Caudoviricetes sp.]